MNYSRGQYRHRSACNVSRAAGDVTHLPFLAVGSGRACHCASDALRNIATRRWVSGKAVLHALKLLVVDSRHVRQCVEGSLEREGRKGSRKRFTGYWSSFVEAGCV